MKVLFSLLSVMLISTPSIAAISDDFSYSSKSENFDGSVTYKNPKVVYAGERLTLVEVYRARRGHQSGPNPQKYCVDFTNRVSKTSDVICAALGFKKVVGIETRKVSSLVGTFASTSNGENGKSTSLEEYQAEYPVSGTGEYGSPFTIYCDHYAEGVNELTCK